MAEKCRLVLTHRASLTSSLCPFGWKFGLSLNLFVRRFQLRLLPGPSASARDVSRGRPEPWSELHWCEPVALSAGQPGAPVSSKACAHGLEASSPREQQSLRTWIRGESTGPLVGRVAFFLNFLADPLGTMHYRYFARRRHSGST